MWYTRGRGQVGSVLEGLASWDGIGILFDSSTEDTQVSSDLLSPSPPSPSPSTPCPRLRWAQVARHLPCRTAPSSVYWPVMRTLATSRVGKGLSGHTPTPFLGPKGLSGDPHCVHKPLPQPLTGTHLS